MIVRIVLPGIVAAAVLAVALPARAIGLQTRPVEVGGFASGRAAASVNEPTAYGAPALGGEQDQAVIMEFTPRGGSSLLPDGTEQEPLPRVRFDMSVGATSPEWLDDIGVSAGRQPSWLADPGKPPAGLSIGGALHWSNWMVGGSLARANLDGAQADLVGAVVGYGPLRANLSFGQAERVDQQPLDVLMLSTDLAAWSWLTVESNLALGSSTGQDEVAVGRLGVRLNF